MVEQIRRDHDMAPPPELTARLLGHHRRPDRLHPCTNGELTIEPEVKCGRTRRE
jgi:hypothetical protein